MKDVDLKNRGPVLVTGCGGSGTRVMAEVLEKLGGYIGYNHNGRPLDNMDSGYFLTGNTTDMKALFRFGRKQEYTRKKIILFEKAFFFERYAFRDWCSIIRILFSYIRPGDFWAVWKRPHRTGEPRLFTLLKLFRIKKQPPVPADAKFWAFKDPDAVYLLRALLSFYPGMKLIHLVRDGRDMAISQQKKPYMFYSEIFDADKEYSIGNVFKYWSEFNMWVLNFTKEHMSEKNSLFVRFEDLCSNPVDEINRIAEFLDIDVPGDSPAYQIPRQIKTIGRWKDRTEAFDNIEKGALRKFNYI